MVPASAGLLNSFLAAIQASLSVLLVIFYGGLSAHLNLLSSTTGKAISKICVKVFLPALLLTKIGSELHAGSAHRYGLILLWAFLCHFVSFLIGVAAHYVFGMQDWITAAIMFNNTTSYPLLLIQSLDETGILGVLVGEGEGTREAIERAKSYFLVFATVSSCLTFAVGPRLIDSEHAPEEEGDGEGKGDDDVEDEEDGGLVRGFEYEYGSERNGRVGERERPTSPTEQSGLLAPPSQTTSRRQSAAPTSFFPSRNRLSSPSPFPDTDPEVVSSRHPSTTFDRRPSVISKRRWITLSDRWRWWLLFLWDFINTPLIGAVLGAIIGLVPSLHRAFFADTQDGGIFTAWLTASLKNVGGLFVPLPVVVAGVSLYGSMKGTSSVDEGRRGRGREGTPISTTLFVLVVRFVVWPVLSIATIYALAKKTDWLGSDPMLWFTLMLMPTGPPAMKLITMVQVSYANEAEEHKIAKLLTISYVISPILAFTVVGALKASQAAIGT
ncbi:hypothetical protein ACEPPN_006705 [Leptodophora sp. 'Broadleaf-Isolate-01']